MTGIRGLANNSDKWLARLRSSTIARNTAALLGTQVATYLFPLATIPYLARVLGPVHWGMVAFAQALGLYLSMVVDFGFQLSATRRVARARESREHLEQIAAGVMGAKVMLAAACVVIVVLMQAWMPTLRPYALIVWAGALSGIGQGFSMLWFFQGMERMRLPAALDMAGKAIAAGGIFLLVHTPQDAWKVLALQCVCYCAIAVALLVIAYRELEFRRPSWHGTRQSLRDSAAMFLFRSSVSLYTTANALILGAVSTPVAVGFYSGAERLVKAMLNLLTPLSQSLFPRLTRLLVTDRQRAVWLARLSLLLMTAAAGVLSLITLIGAPFIIRFVLGPGYGAAVPVMRVLALLLPAIAISTVLGMQWMLPLGMDAVYNKIILSAGLLNLALAVLWASRWQQMGMAYAVVVSEYMVMFAVVFILVRRKISPFSEPATLEYQLQRQLAGVDAR